MHLCVCACDSRKTRTILRMSGINGVVCGMSGDGKKEKKIIIISGEMKLMLCRSRSVSSRKYLI